MLNRTADFQLAIGITMRQGHGGGAGLIITELTKVERRIENSPRMRLAYAGSDAMLVEMTDLVEAVHDFGTKIALQLTAGLGRQADVIETATPPVSCSPLPSYADPSVICHALTREEIQELVGGLCGCVGTGSNRRI